MINDIYFIGEWPLTDFHKSVVSGRVSKTQNVKNYKAYIIYIRYFVRFIIFNVSNP